jgi:hypothetical protein
MVIIIIIIIILSWNAYLAEKRAEEGDDLEDARAGVRIILKLLVLRFSSSDRM